MKTLKIIVLGLLIPLSQVTQAQEHIEQQKAIVSRMENVVSTVQTEKDPKTLQPKSSIETYQFTVKRSSTLLQSLLGAFGKDENKAYNVYRGNTTGSTYRLGSLIIGKDYPNYVLQCFADPDDSLKRYAYALEWSSTAKGRIITGRMTKVYGDRPRTKSLMRDLPKAWQSIPNTFRWMDMKPFNSKKMDETMDRLIQALKDRGYTELSNDVRREWDNLKAQKETTKTVSSDGQDALFRQYANGESIVVDGAGNLVFNGLHGNYVMDTVGNIVVNNEGKRTLILSNK